MSISGNKQLQDKVKRLQNALRNTVPKRLGNDARRFFLESFRRQGFLDKTLQLWPKVKKQRTVNGKAVGGRILKGRGLLMNSIRIVRSDWNGIVVAAGGPHVRYAQIHNEGGTITTTASVRAFDRRKHMANTRRGRVARKAARVRAHHRRMNTVIPKRQFMGRSAALEGVMRGTIQRTIVETLLK